MIPSGADGVARIGLMFLDGDAFEKTLLDQEGFTDYRFDAFNGLRACLTRIEQLDPELDLSAILWRFLPGNSYVAEPIVCGNALPQTGWRRAFANREQRETYLRGEPTVHAWTEACASHYYALRNSDDEIVGLLELLVGRGYRKDVDSNEMFMEPVERPDPEEEER